MIDKQQYKQAVLALSSIANNHPNSSKVQYTLAQAQAGLGNLPAAKEALDRAIALNPKLDFVSVTQVEQLQQAIQPQVSLIKAVPNGPSLWEYLLVILSFGIVGYLVYKKYYTKPSKIPTPEVKADYRYSRRSEAPKEAPSRPVYNRTSSYEPSKQAYDRDSYPVRTSRPAEVHHHHSVDKSDVFTTLATAGLTAAAVSYMMDDDKPNHSTSSYEPETSTWDDASDISSTWDDSTPSKDTSWEDSSSTRSSNSSWSDSSSSSSSSDSSSSWD